MGRIIYLHGPLNPIDNLPSEQSCNILYRRETFLTGKTIFHGSFLSQHVHLINGPNNLIVAVTNTKLFTRQVAYNHRPQYKTNNADKNTSHIDNKT